MGSQDKTEEAFSSKWIVAWKARILENQWPWNTSQSSGFQVFCVMIWKNKFLRQPVGLGLEKILLYKFTDMGL